MDPINAITSESLNAVESIRGLQQSTQQLNAAANKTDRSEDSIEVAKKFESILFNQMINEMKNTIGQWGEEKDGPSQQVHSLFWSQLGQNLGEKGGLGLWQDIHQNLFNGTDASSLLEESV